MAKNSGNWRPVQRALFVPAAGLKYRSMLKNEVIMEIEEIIKELRAQLNTFEIKLANLDKCHLNTSAQIQAWADTKKELLTEIAALKNEIESRHDSILSEKDKILKKNAAPATGLTGDCDIDGVIEV